MHILNPNSAFVLIILAMQLKAVIAICFSWKVLAKIFILKPQYFDCLSCIIYASYQIFCARCLKQAIVIHFLSNIDKMHFKPIFVIFFSLKAFECILSA